VALYGFFAFFAGLIYYLRREDKREGYPLESDRSRSITVQGFPPIPSPKVFRLPHGGTRSAPRAEAPRGPLQAVLVSAWPGAPLAPIGDPMTSGVGPGSYALRAEEPDLTVDGLPKIVPISSAGEFTLEARDPDPRGMPVVGADGALGGMVRDIWIDRAEVLIRYLEVETPTASGARRVLLPMTFAKVDGRRHRVKVNSITGTQFAGVPGLRNPDRVTFREEDQIAAYYGGGTLYATPARAEPML
jgi:photosynthetic reaction center H subunit